MRLKPTCLVLSTPRETQLRSVASKLKQNVKYVGNTKNTATALGEVSKTMIIVPREI